MSSNNNSNNNIHIENISSESDVPPDIDHEGKENGNKIT